MRVDCGGSAISVRLPLCARENKQGEHNHNLMLPLLTFARARVADVSRTMYLTPKLPAPPPLSFYNTLFWYGGASSDDTDELPAMNFQDLLERYDLPAIEQSSENPRVSCGSGQGGGVEGRG